MRKSVANAFLDWSIPFEGYLDHMYLDVLGLVTTGIGNLIDPKVAALDLPWRRGDGSLADYAEVSHEWDKIKAAKHLAHRGGRAFHPLTTLHLDRDAIHALCRRRLYQNDAIMRQRWPAYDTWPASAQLAVLSLAWAAGPHFIYPKMTAHLARGDFAAAAEESGIRGNPKRSKAQRELLLHAAQVVAEGGDYEGLPG